MHQSETEECDSCFRHYFYPHGSLMMSASSDRARATSASSPGPGLLAGAALPRCSARMPLPWSSQRLSSRIVYYCTAPWLIRRCHVNRSGLISAKRAIVIRRAMLLGKRFEMRPNQSLPQLCCRAVSDMLHFPTVISPRAFRHGHVVYPARPRALVTVPTFTVPRDPNPTDEIRIFESASRGYHLQHGGAVPRQSNASPMRMRVRFRLFLPLPKRTLVGGCAQSPEPVRTTK
jgi:hypothetical protein